MAAQITKGNARKAKASSLIRGPSGPPKIARHMTLTFLLVAFCLVAKAQNRATSAPPSEIYITHVTVIDTETGKEATNQTAVISGGKIAVVAESKKLSAPTSARIVDGRGKYLIPGLWDMHVHRTEYESTYPCIS